MNKKIVICTRYLTAASFWKHEMYRFQVFNQDLSFQIRDFSFTAWEAQRFKRKLKIHKVKEKLISMKSESKFEYFHFLILDFDIF